MAIRNVRKRKPTQLLEDSVRIHNWQVDHIRQGLRESDAGKFLAAAEVKRRIGRLRRVHGLRKGSTTRTVP
jgi:predicted transcriptional regulator